MDMQPGILALENKTSEHYAEIKKAMDFFDYTPSVKVVAQSGIKTNTKSSTNFIGINRFGMVELVGLKNTRADGDTANISLDSVMEHLSNILVASVLKHAGTEESAQVDPKYWKEGYNALIALFCHNYSSDYIEYSDKKVGKDSVAAVIKIGFDVNGEPSSSLKDAIEKYLSKQGALMDQVGMDGTLNNPYTLIGFSNFTANEKHTCAFRAYFTKFDTQSIRIKKSCKDDTQAFDFNFKITHCNADFMLSSWETDPAFQKKVMDFIEKHDPETPYFDELSTGKIFTF